MEIGPLWKHLIYLYLAFSSALFGNGAEIFTKIYETWPWSEEGFLFSGSSIEITHEYVDFLETFMKENEIRSVLDIGCGDWAYCRYIDWDGIEYVGIDVVKMVIDRNQKLYSNDSIQFIHGDVLTIDLPQADLVICKDVFQHLSNKDILTLLDKMKQFQHCLVTNFVDPITFSAENTEIETGAFHNIDLSNPPFNIDGEAVLQFIAVRPKQTFYFRN